jgi:hypothetical protein
MVVSEDAVQAAVRIAASEMGWRIWRNNVGVLLDKRGVPVRFGLANDSKAINDVLKSGDLIGCRPVLITQKMVGRTIGQFVSIECKTQDWKQGNTKRDDAQRAWAMLVRALGGHAIFATCVADLTRENDSVF